MKTKHIFKTITIIMMLVLTVFTTGCESQQEKYTRVSNELDAYKIKTVQNIKATLDKLELEGRKSNDTKKLDEMVDFVIGTLDEAEKHEKECLENLQKIAKGDPELEKDVRKKWDEFNKKRQQLPAFKEFYKNFAKQAKQQLGK